MRSAVFSRPPWQRTGADADHAVVDIRKLRDYILSPMHRIGKHKARVFMAALNMTADDAESLRRALLQAVGEQEVELGLEDEKHQIAGCGRFDR